MPTRSASADWSGSLTEGKGTMSFGSGAYTGAYTYKSRFEEGQGTNPEELIGAAHAGCFSMALANELAERGSPPEDVHTDARVSLNARDGGFEITQVELVTRARVRGIDTGGFLDAAHAAKEGCPVSKLLAGAEIILHASLEPIA
ncbi:MAG: OsmC family protein [Nocardioidaceae bacterium]